jgi:hypothetical protein
MQRHKNIRRAAWTIAILALIFVAALFVLKDDDCWPEPEPVPADCKPGQLCPVEDETSDKPGEVSPLPAVPVDPPVPVTPQETTGGVTG